MSESAVVQSAAIFTTDTLERKHRRRLAAAWMASTIFVAGFVIYGFDYYTLGSTERPFSPKHALLRPSGAIGVNLGVFGVLLFFLIYLYPCARNGAGSAGRAIPATGWISTSSWAPPRR
jgi:hypothetical protein